MTTAFHPIHSIADLWREARAWLAAALDDFRGPAKIASTLARAAADRSRGARHPPPQAGEVASEASGRGPAHAPFRPPPAPAATRAASLIKGEEGEPFVRRRDRAVARGWRVARRGC